MNRLLDLSARADAMLRALAPALLPTLARAVFAAVLLVYFWSSAQTKIGEGLFGLFMPTDGAYIQIFPRQVEALGYDTGKLSVFHWAVAVAGTAAEFALPFLIVIGLATRLAAAGMAGFVLVQSFVDVTGHMVAGDDLGAWFDSTSGALILDQRLLWMMPLVVLALLGGGPLSADRLLAGRLRARPDASARQRA